MQKPRLLIPNATPVLGLLMATLALAATAGAPAEAPPPAQMSDEDREIELADDALETSERINRLEATIEELLVRIERLETTLNSYERTAQVAKPGERTRGADGTTGGSRARKHEEPLDSPEVITERMRSDFQNDLLRDPSFVLGVDSPNIRAREEADRVLRNWMEKSTRLFRKPVTWNVRTLRRALTEDGDTRCEFQIIRANGTPDTRTLDIIVPSRFERRIEGWREKTDFRGLALKGFIQPRLRLIPTASSDEKMTTQVIFESETHVALNEWIEVRYDFRLSSVTPRFEQIQDTVEEDRESETEDAIR